MKCAIGVSIFIAALVISLAAQSAEIPRLLRGGEYIYGGNFQNSKAVADTIQIMGPANSGAPYIGDFEAGWNGWTSEDVTAPTSSHWQVSDYNQVVPGNLAAWCGDISIIACDDSLDVVGGYGNSWHDLLGYRVAVANPAIVAMVNVTASLQNDTEPGYDRTRLSVKVDGVLGYTDIQSWDGQQLVNVNSNFSVLPMEFNNGTDVHILWRVETDGSWSDEDCLWQTSGACQVDDITVTVTQAGESDIVSFTDFQDGTFGDWAIDFPQGVGDFTALWRQLEDLDPCGANFSQQLAFIDDGNVVLGTGGSQCLNWCYGPGGYIVNTTGGLAGPSSHIHIAVNSPVMPWPNAAYDGILFSYDLYDHADLDTDSPGIFWEWNVRSADTDGSAGAVEVLDEQPWVNRIFRIFPGPQYLRHSHDVAELIHPGRDEFQVQVGVYELGWAFGFAGDDGSPAPYYDNISVKIFPLVGPAMTTREIDLAQDNFPEVDAFLEDDLAAMHVRFDMASNISLITHMRNDPGDSLVVNIAPLRADAVLVNPALHYSVKTNPLFDGVRMAGFSATGAVPGAPALINGVPSPTKWAFDLPDSGFLFPGDVLHYYFRAGENLMGDVTYNILPADISGFGDFDSGPLAYDTSFVVHALPSIKTIGSGTVIQPPMLFWNDNGNRGSQDEWYSALSQLGYQEGIDYDIYYTNGPVSGVGNGLGGRTAGPMLGEYEHMLYSAGSQGFTTISNGDYQFDAGDDVATLMNWLSLGERDMYLTGDSFVDGMAYGAGAASQAFVEDVLGLNLVTHSVRGFIDNQSAPLVVALPGNSTIINIDSWIAYGSCVAVSNFDGVTVRAGAERLAEFANPSGAAGIYPYSALTKNIHNSTNRIFSQPYSFGNLNTNPDENVTGAYTGRIQVLHDIIQAFGLADGTNVTGVVPVTQFAASAYPNPFNPMTKISYTIKAPGHLSLKVFDVRGALVKTLIDGQVTEDSFVMWNGTNNQGSEVSSGVYFYEARMGNEIEVNKMALVK